MHGCLLYLLHGLHPVRAQYHHRRRRFEEGTSARRRPFEGVTKELSRARKNIRKQGAGRTDASKFQIVDSLCSIFDDFRSREEVEMNLPSDYYHGIPVHFTWGYDDEAMLIDSRLRYS